MNAIQWENCYNDSWNGVITPESFAHPAKFAPGLITRIVDHFLREGYVKKGDLIGDPFGGVGLGGVICGCRGLNWIGVELEPRFVKMGNKNLAKHATAFTLSDASMVKLVQGDSRNFASIVGGAAGIVTSPPFVQSGVTDHQGQTDALKGKFNGGGDSFLSNYSYGHSEGQIGDLQAGDVAAIVTSPPFLGGHQGCASDAETKERVDAGKLPPMGHAHGNDYGTTEGQIGDMQAGDVDAIVTSPPFVDCGANLVGCADTPGRCQRITGGKPRHDAYGTTDGQIGSMPKGEVDAIVTSPPFSVPGCQPIANCPSFAVRSVRKANRLDDKTEYGHAEGQIGNLPTGEVDAIVTSPPFSMGTNQPTGQGHGVRSDYAEGKRTADTPETTYGVEQGQIGAMTTGSVDAIVTSPPFADQEPTRDDNFRYDGKKLGSTGKHYGVEAGQIGNLRGGDVDAIVTSPPYADTAVNDAQRHSNHKDGDGAMNGPVPYGTTPGNLGNPSPGTIGGIITSPPFEDVVNTKDQKYVSEKKLYGDYGDSPGQIGQLHGGSVDGIVTSPPYEATGVAGGVDTPEAVARKAELLEAGGHDAKKWLGKKRYTQMRNDGYGKSEGQIGQETKDDYWHAVCDVYRECYRSLRPGGYMAVVVKSYVAKGKIVPLPDDTWRLLLHVGFEGVAHVHAMLVKSESHPGLFGEEIVKTKARKSFFRRLAEAKGSPEINWEDVLIVRKPL
jgi:DNA modification methylase